MIRGALSESVPVPDRRLRRRSFEFESESEPETKPSRSQQYYHQQAEAIYDLQMREAIMRFFQEGLPAKEIARRLGQHVNTIHAYKRAALRDAAERAAYAQMIGRPLQDVFEAHVGQPPPPSLPPIRERITTSKTKHKAYWPVNDREQRALPSGQPPRFETGSPPPPPPPPPPPKPPPSSASGEVLDPPEILQLRKDCLKLRKAMVSFEQMALALGISEQDAVRHTAEALRQLRESEAVNSDNERTLMIAQIDQMIEAIHPMSTGYSLHTGPRPVVLEAVDRMLKLMQKKAELLGFSTPPAIDIRIRLQALASEGGYDILDLEDIAREVLASQKLKLPEFR